MKKSLFTFFMLMLIGSVVYAQTVPVTFRVKMGARVFNKAWDPAKDSVTVRGSFQKDAGKGDWSGFDYKMSGNMTDTIYTVTADIPNTYVGKQYEYKFVVGPDTWESVKGDNVNGNRYFTLGASAMTLSAYWFNDDSAHIAAPTVINTINFNVDMSQLLKGGFDPYLDNIQVMGLNWDGNGTVLSADSLRKLVEDPFVAGVYSTSLSVKGFLGDSLRWKYKGNPDASFNNNGWEDPNRFVTLKSDGSTVDLVAEQPKIYHVQAGLASALNILFECNIKTTPAAINFKNKRVIPVDSVTCIGLKGGAAPLGSWGGGWVALDTVSPSATMIKLLDDGTNGDKVKGDHVFSALVTFPAGTPTGIISYKYAAFYPAWSDDGSGSLDNELDYGQNHELTLTQTGPLLLHSDFGNKLTAIKDVKSPGVITKYELNQNYPNPFNPTTKITFSVPVDGNVVMKIYNVMGQEVATLVNEYVKAGAKEVTFNASSMPTGMYVYSIKAGNFSATRKMMLLK